MIALEERILKLIERQEDMLGIAGLGRANTATLHVSPDGDGSDGLSWRTAYTTPPDAFDACSADANDLTLVLMAPATYDFNLPGEPTWTQNIVVQGSHRDFVIFTNTHVTASCVLRLEGLSVVQDVTITPVAADNGLLLWADGARASRLRIDGTGHTGAGVGLWLNGDDGKATDIDILGNVAQTIGINVLGARTHYENLHIDDCAIGIWVHNAGADGNLFDNIFIHGCALGIDIDSGNDQHFKDIHFLDNTRDVDDEVGDSQWLNIRGRFDIEILPDNFTGVTVNTGAANTYGADTELLSAVSRDNPFRIVGISVEPSTGEWYKLRLSDDSGVTFFDEIQFEGTKRQGEAAPSGTEHIFNKGTRISGSVKDISGGDNVKVWLEIQET
ncbi:hypothetical protein LCGC14_1768630 [marine sediment metagenome]|uniref:Right handed beta helix domain-containing protein n=1 Tax=marine sediment metagenome TaxID=412755 RepID=A0A0F9GYZ0_9ZZZZ